MVEEKEEKKLFCEPCGMAGKEVTEGVELIEQEIIEPNGKTIGKEKVPFCKECRIAMGFKD